MEIDRGYQSFGEFIRDQRGPQSQRATAVEAGIDHASISRIENTEIVPLTSTYLALARALAFDERTLIEGLGVFSKSPNLYPALEKGAMNPLAQATGSFGERLAFYRRGLRLSLRQLATKMGISHTTVYRIEKENRIPKIDLIAPLALGLKLSPDQLINLLSPLGAEETSQ